MQIFTLDLMLALLITLLVVPIILYLNYVYSLKVFHIKKLEVVISRYYTFSNIITYICLAKIDNQTGKFLPNYIDYTNSLMWAVDNYPNNLRQGLRRLCIRVFGYNNSDVSILNMCVNKYLPIAGICKDINENYKWFITDRFGTVYYISKALRDEIENIIGISNPLRQRLFLAYFMDYYLYKKPPTIPSGTSYVSLSDLENFENRQEYIILAPFGGVIRSYTPLIFLNVNESKYWWSDANLADITAWEIVYELSNIHRNFTPKLLPIGLISNELEFKKFIETPEEAILVNLHGEITPAIYEYVKNVTMLDCTNDINVLDNIYVTKLREMIEKGVIWFNIWGYPVFYLSSFYCSNWTAWGTRNVVMLGSSGLNTLAGISSGWLQNVVSATVNSNIKDVIEDKYGISLSSSITLARPLSATPSEWFYRYGNYYSGFWEVGNGGVFSMGIPSRAMLSGNYMTYTLAGILYLEDFEKGGIKPHPNIYYVVILSWIKDRDIKNYITQLT